jgi:hypothetical protein
MIHVKSKTDVITNSSSEVFIMKRLPGDTRTWEEITKAIKAHHEAHMSEWVPETKSDIQHPDEENRYDCYSGDVQDIETETYDQMFEESKKRIPKLRRGEYTKKMFNISQGWLDAIEDEDILLIRLDQGFSSTIYYILKNFFVFETWMCGWVHDENGRYTHKDYEKFEEQYKEEHDGEEW